MVDEYLEISTLLQNRLPLMQQFDLRESAGYRMFIACLRDHARLRVCDSKCRFLKD